MNFNAEQKSYIENPKIEDTVLIACPGSGKTTCILNRIYYLIDKLKILPHKIIFLSFNKCTVDDAQNRFKDRPGFDKHRQIRTIDSLCFSIINSINHEFAKDVSMLTIKIQRVSDEEFESAIPRTNIPRIIFVDEAQDLNELHRVFIKRYISIIAKMRDPYIFGEDVPTVLGLVGDMNQTINQFRGSSSSYLETFAAHKFALNINYRSNSKIIALANTIMPIKGKYFMKTANLDNDKIMCPTIFFPDRQELIFEKIKKLFEAKGIAETICIASPWRGKDQLCGTAYLTNMLTKYGIPFKQYYDESINHDNKSQIKYNLVKNKVLVFTYHMLKGLEFDYTIIFDTYHNLYGGCPDEKSHAYHKFLMFVAMTRAKKTLWICNLDHHQVLNTTIIKLIQNHEELVNKVGKVVGLGAQNFRDRKFPFDVTSFINDLELRPDKLLLLESLIPHKIKCIYKHSSWENNIYALNRNQVFNGKYLKKYFANVYGNCINKLDCLGRKYVPCEKSYLVNFYNSQMIKMSKEHIELLLKKPDNKKKEYNVDKIIEAIEYLHEKGISAYGDVIMFHDPHNILNFDKINKDLENYQKNGNASLIDALIDDHAIATYHYWISNDPGSRKDIAKETKFLKDISIFANEVHDKFPDLRYHSSKNVILEDEILDAEIDFDNDESIIEIKTYNCDTIPFKCVLQLLLSSNFDIMKKFYMINLRNGKVYQLKFDKFDIAKVIHEMLHSI